MLCDICGKNQATVHLTEIVDEKVTELHLCEDCAKEKGAQMESHFGLADLLGGLADFGTQPETEEETSIKCPACGLTYKDFKKIGRLGCGQCYSAFKRVLVPLLKRIHGSSQHMGKSPVKITKEVKTKSELQELKEKLQRAIQTEEFEDAARLRDKIKELENKEAKNKNKNKTE